MLKNIFLIFTLPLTVLGIVIAALSWIIITTPNVLDLKECLVTSMYQVKLCPKDPSYVPLNRIATVVQQAVLVSEDSSFFNHNGFDWYEIQNSLNKNLSEKAFARGGSTITQQLAKNVFLNKDKTIARKLREALLTYELEKNFTKLEILEKYLNVVEFGPNIYGIKAAAQYYFKKSPAELHLLDAAFLAMLLPNPKAYSVSFRKKALTKFARQQVLSIIFRLQAFKKIPAESYKQAKNYVDTFPWSQLSRDSFAPVSTVLENPDGEPVLTTPTDYESDQISKDEEALEKLAPPAEDPPSEDEPPIEPTDGERSDDNTEQQQDSEVPQ